MGDSQISESGKYLLYDAAVFQILADVHLGPLFEDRDIVLIWLSEEKVNDGEVGYLVRKSVN